MLIEIEVVCGKVLVCDNNSSKSKFKRIFKKAYINIDFISDIVLEGKYELYNLYTIHMTNGNRYDVTEDVCSNIRTRKGN